MVIANLWPSISVLDILHLPLFTIPTSHCNKDLCQGEHKHMECCSDVHDFFILSGTFGSSSTISSLELDRKWLCPRCEQRSVYAGCLASIQQEKEVPLHVFPRDASG